MKKLIYFLAVCALILCACNANYSLPDAAEGVYYENDTYDAMPDTPNPEGGDKFEDFADNPFLDVAKNPQSTFSVDADGASYAYMRRSLTTGYKLNKSSVRIEEYLNYFTFDYPDPTDGNDISINAEIGICPWNSEHRLLRLGLKGKHVEEADMPQSNYVFLIDVSGSMSGSDRLDLLKSGLVELVDHLKPTDRISIVTYSGEEKLLLESTPIKERDEIVKAIKKLEASGCTSGASALQMAYKQAETNYIVGGNNRIIMGTDGDFNVGVTSTEGLLEIVSEHADKGIYLTVCGFGMGNWNDGMMEKVSNAGNGTYVYVDSEDEMMKVFCHERSHLLSVANDTKVQITFDPQQVSKYRLIGYENRVMANEDFEDDTKDAGEIGAGQTITALYELVPAEGWQDGNSAGRFDVRYKKALGEESLPLSIDMKEWSADKSENLNFAAGVAAFGMILRDSEYKGEATLSMAYKLIEENRSFDPHGYREQLAEIIKKVNE